VTGRPDAVCAVYGVAEVGGIRDDAAQGSRFDSLAMTRSSGQRPPVVLLHGFATSTARTWREPGWFNLLHDAGRRAVGIDLLGHGEAPKPTDPDAYIDLADPSRVRTMVLAAVGRNLMAAENQRPDSLENVVPNTGSARTDMEPHVLQRFDSLIHTEGNDSEALTACMSVERPPFTPEQLAKLDIPCLIVIGDNDFAGPPEPLANALPDAPVTVLRKVDHFGLPKQFSFIDAALGFIDAVPDWA